MNELQTRRMWVEACAAGLAHLPDIGPSRMSALLQDAPPDAVWEMLATGAPLSAATRSSIRGADSLIDKWRVFVRRNDPLEIVERYRRYDIGVWTRFGNYPERLVPDEHAPAVAFWRGDARLLSLPTVAIIGTRNCTTEGRMLARQFGLELAEAGVAVVSGLALGVDGAAHAGALDTAMGVGPIAVVGSGLDVVYPRRHNKLWADVAERGLIISESHLGARPEPWRFPSRNRIIAGLADLVLVIESHDRGGSLLTVDEAIERNVPVMAVPGSIRSAASRGTNRLLSECAAPACSTQDVLDELRWAVLGERVQLEVSDKAMPMATPMDQDVPVLEAVDYTATSTDEILLRTSLSLGEVATALMRLEAVGLVNSDGGWWYRM